MKDVYPEHFVQFGEATAIYNDRGFSQRAREAIEIKKHMFANLSINRDTGNLNTCSIYDNLYVILLTLLVVLSVFSLFFFVFFFVSSVLKTPRLHTGKISASF